MMYENWEPPRSHRQKKNQYPNVNFKRNETKIKVIESLSKFTGINTSEVALITDFRHVSGDTYIKLDIRPDKWFDAYYFELVETQ